MKRKFSNNFRENAQKSRKQFHEKKLLTVFVLILKLSSRPELKICFEIFVYTGARQTKVLSFAICFDFDVKKLQKRIFVSRIYENRAQK